MAKKNKFFYIGNKKILIIVQLHHLVIWNGKLFLNLMMKKNFIARLFDIVSDKDIENKIVLDAGCGSGRWTKYIVNKAKHVELVDPSEAIFVAAKLLKILVMLL